MDQSFLDDLEELSDSYPLETQQLPPTSISNLLQNPQFLAHVTSIKSIINPKAQLHNVQKTNNYLVSIQRQISSITKFIKDIYKKRFPEIQSAVVNPIQYVKTVMIIQDSPNDKITQKDLHFLSPHQALSITLSISSAHEHLNSKDSAQLRVSCEDVLKLSQIKDLFFSFVESCISSICPNLCNLVGTTVASKLVTSAGGIAELSNTPACNIQLLGGERGPSLGFGMMTRNHTGVFGTMEMVQKAPNEFQMELVRMLANKAAIAARVDKLGVCPSGFEGDKLREALLQRFEKIQEKGMAATLKALPIPGEQPKKKRGGKRYRRQKELMGISQIGKLQNRTEFGKAEEQTIEGVGMGMIKSSGHIRGKIKKAQKLNPSKKIIAQLKKDRQAGLESTLNFDATHQMELINPDKSLHHKGTETYFNRETGFKTVLEEKMKMNKK